LKVTVRIWDAEGDSIAGSRKVKLGLRRKRWQHARRRPVVKIDEKARSYCFGQRRFVVAGAAPAQALRWHECSESKARMSDLKVVNERCRTARVVIRAWLRTDICDERQGVSSACWVTPRGRQWECIYTRKLKRARADHLRLGEAIPRCEEEADGQLRS
jgi:hypothetical protein